MERPDKRRDMLRWRLARMRRPSTLAECRDTVDVTITAVLPDGYKVLDATEWTGMGVTFGREFFVKKLSGQ